VRFLLDTHVLIWMWNEPKRLPQPFQGQITDPANDGIVSAASIWEIAIKFAAGKLSLPGPAVVWLPQALQRFRLQVLEITAQHALTAGALPRIHGDPFDRMLVAQAQTEALTLVTADPIFRQYSVSLQVI
jgi:PIN domain nuclease of toxin-antitoxin system